MKRMTPDHRSSPLLLLFILLFTDEYVYSESNPKHQFFKVKPKDKEVREGETVELHCHVGHKAGDVQWSKDGFLLGYPRYHMISVEEKGIYNLRIENAQLEDEAEFQCQVGPTPNQKPIRAKAKLTLLLPPKHLTINGLDDGSEVMVKDSDKLTLTCSAEGSKPAAEISWYLKTIKLVPEAAKTTILKGPDKRFTTMSMITLYPKMDQAGAIYTCEANHIALDKPIRTSVTVGVFVPPQAPQIQGYSTGDVVKIGDRITLLCTATGGRPYPSLIWYKNDEVSDVTFASSAGVTSNTYTFLVGADDHNSVYRCEANNSGVAQPMQASVKLTVLFPPSFVSLSGPTEARKGDAVTVQCKTSLSNPAAQITWLVDGLSATTDETVTQGSPETGWVTSSNLTVAMSRQDSNMRVFFCYAVGIPSRFSVSGTHNVSLLYPPRNLKIFGYDEGNPIKTGDLLVLKCISQGGSPSPTLQWFKNGYKVNTTTSLTKTGVTSEFVSDVKPPDNGATLTCEVINSAMDYPASVAIELTVYFPPENVSISLEPAIVREGQMVYLQCGSSSSNPPSSITWWKNGDSLFGEQEKVVNSSNGGFSTHSDINFVASRADDRSSVICQAQNREFHSTAEDSFFLKVLFKPWFQQVLSRIDVVEGESTVINVTAYGNPEIMQYSWSKEGSTLPSRPKDRAIDPRQRHQVTSSGAVLHIHGIRRFDAGFYVVHATNEQGTSNSSIIINVLYSSVITNLTEMAEGSVGGDVTLECNVDGNPLSNNNARWQGIPSDPRYQVKTWHDGHKTTLTIFNLTEEDMGEVDCVSFNGIGEPSVKTAKVVVFSRPKIIRNDLKTKISGDEGSKVKFICQANGHPPAIFDWYFNGSSIRNSNLTQKYISRHVVSKDYGNWESELIVQNIDKKDYGIYECIARNTVGYDILKFYLMKKGRPEIPTNLVVLNASYDTVLLSWTPGFNGGKYQTFKIRYRSLDSIDYYFYMDAVPGNSTFISVNQLTPNTDYLFSISSGNVLGETNYTEDMLVRTTTVPALDLTAAAAENRPDLSIIPWSWMIAAPIIGGLALTLNVGLLLLCIRKKICCKSNQDSRAQTTTDQVNDKYDSDSGKLKYGVDGQPYFISSKVYDLPPHEHIGMEEYQNSPQPAVEKEAYQISTYYDEARWADLEIRTPESLRVNRQRRHDQDCPDILKPNFSEAEESKTIEPFGSEVMANLAKSKRGLTGSTKSLHKIHEDTNYYTRTLPAKRVTFEADVSAHSKSTDIT